MKVPKAQVPAELWAEKAESNLCGLDDRSRSCLEAWKRSRQVFKINGALWREFEEMDLDEIPSPAFSHLPYPCMYIQHEWKTEQGMTGPLSAFTLVTEHAGMFCWVEDDRLYMADHIISTAATSTRDGRPVPGVRGRKNAISVAEFDLSAGVSIKRHIDDAAQGTRPYLERAFDRAGNQGAPAAIDELIHGFKQGLMYAPAAAALMYIASRNADLECVYHPASNLPKKSRQSRSTITEVGYKIAPKLRELRAAAPTPEPSERRSSETRKAPAPHIRRAHWHGYWTGPKDNPTGLDIKWIGPVLVNAPQADVDGTIHEVHEGGRSELAEFSDGLIRASAALDRRPADRVSGKTI